ncbi:MULTISPECIES: hypothetical protein [Bartonella]|uniref:hypothetical protein n=1 Tax=Bartonella TaxID=773 RepID=UPI0018DB6ADF|nr:MULTISPECIES: hypothetical protein [Bartonella]MBI0170395.1 hypothetical protein [Bartonella sp. W8167]MBI0175627.1 hypothetical protein [Bartonella apis]
MFNFLNNGDAKEKIEKRIQDLKSEIQSLTQSLTKGDGFLENTGEIAETIKDKGRQAFDVVGEQAHYITRQTKNYPKTALAVVGVLGLAAYFLLRRK